MALSMLAINCVEQTLRKYRIYTSSIHLNSMFLHKKQFNMIVVFNRIILRNNNVTEALTQMSHSAGDFKKTMLNVYQCLVYIANEEIWCWFL